jgi:hypothetical protein
MEKYENRISEIIEVKMNQPDLSKKHLEALDKELNILYKYVTSEVKKHYKRMSALC